MTSRKTTVPPLLHPYLSLPPESSLLLLTGVLNASTHWLSVRVLLGALGDVSSRRRNGGREGGSRREEQGNGEGKDEDRKGEGKDEERKGGGKDEEDVAVVLVSWQRDFEFWKTEARRGAGLDLARLAQQDRFAFVDGLTHLLSPPTSTPTPASTPAQPAQTLPLRSHPAVPIRNTAAPTSRRSVPPASTPASTPTPPTQRSPSAKLSPKNQHTLHSPTLSHAQDTITTAISTLLTLNPNKRILLLLDAPSTPLALTPTPLSTPLLQLLLSLRSMVYATVITLETDLPFLQPSVHALSQSRDTGEMGEVSEMAEGRMQSPLATEMARLLVGLAHQARWVVGVRGLDTGVARDVSGVVRCSRGGAWDDDFDEEEEEVDDMRQEQAKEIEVLHFVQGDGRVNVFERGGGEIG
ncbi:hypothetical protein BDV97DRAFT_65453 [Delphinella strobiligena]|nr:hypothetical protein BDV97DRAFT_65453 [Delphinella strobiligena]